MYYPKLSIITVVYNGASTLERTIQSVLGQDYRNIEYIIIDGASTDGTVKIIEKYADKISYWVSEKDNGIYDAMNKGIRYATGDIIAFLNSDDWYLSNCLAYVAKQFEINPADVCFFGVTREDKDGKRADRYPQIRIAENKYEQLAVFHPATFVKKSVFSEIGDFNTEYHIAADYDWLVRMKMQGYAIIYDHYITTYYSDGGISNVNWFEAQEEAEQIELKYAKSKEEREYIHLLYAQNWANKKYLELIRSENISYFASKELDIYRSKNIYIFGAGNAGIECCRLFYQNGIKIKGFLDNSQLKQEKLFQGYLVLAPEIIGKEYDYIIISSVQYADEIENQLLQLNVRGDKIVVFANIKNKILARLKEERLTRYYEM